MKRLRKLLSLFLVLFCTQSLYSQNIGINETGNLPDPSAMLDVNSNTKGMLVPRLTKAQRLAIVIPANGLLAYQTDDTIGFWYYDQTTWVPLMVSVTAGNGLNGGQIFSSGTIDLANTSVVAVCLQRNLHFSVLIIR